MIERKYSKLEKGLHHEQMIEVMQSMGLKIPNIPFAIEVLKNVNFHKFVKVYGMKYFVDGSEQFEAGTCFEDIYHLYRFDTLMSAFLEKGLRASEVKTLSVLVDHYSINYGIFSHADSNNFLHKHAHNQSLKIWNKLYNTNIAEIPFYKLYNYVSFGFVDKIIHYAKYEDQKTICRNLGIKPKYYKLLPNWIKHLNKVRNSCAHNNKLFDSVFSVFKLPNSLSNHYDDYNNYQQGTFGCVIILSFIVDKGTFLQLVLDIKRLEKKFSRFNLDLGVFGFPKEWIKVIKDVRKEILL